MGTPTLTVAFWRYDRTQPLIDGRVSPDGFDLACSILRPEDAFALAFGDAPFDITEISLSNTLSTVSQRPLPYLLIPVFP